MAKFKLKVTQTVEWYMTVEAENYEEAEKSILNDTAEVIGTPFSRETNRTVELTD